jgi:hypothetical protein
MNPRPKKPVLFVTPVAALSDADQVRIEKAAGVIIARVADVSAVRWMNDTQPMDGSLLLRAALLTIQKHGNYGIQAHFGKAIAIFVQEQMNEVSP